MGTYAGSAEVAGGSNTKIGNRVANDMKNSINKNDLHEIV
jgi:hypothetical protein